MPRTTDRASDTLHGDAIGAMLARGVVDVRWSVRFADMDGVPLTPGSWIYYEVPGEAIVERQRTLGLAGGPASLGLTLLAEKVPTIAAPKTYWRIEVDRVIGQPVPNHWPYFSGIIDHISRGWALQDGAVVETWELECFGVLQRAKGYWIDSLAIDPVRGTTAIYKLLGACAEFRGSFAASGPSTNQILPGATVTFDLANRVALDNDSAFGSPYTYTTDYTVDTTKSPAEVNWTGTGPAQGTTVYFKFPRVEYFGIRRHQGGTLPAFFRCPRYRDHRDLYHTEVSSYVGGGSPAITPKDPVPYDSDLALLDPSGQVEYLSVTDQDSPFTESIVQVASTTAAGVINLSAAPSFTPAAGDPIKLITTEMFAAWEEFGGRPSGTDRNQIRFWRDSGATVNEGDGSIDASETVVTVSDGTKFAASGETILIEAEQMYVSSKAGNDLTVTRATNGTAAATHANGLAIYIEYERNLFRAQPDIGIATCAGKHFAAADAVYVTASPILGGESGASADANRVEERLKDLLGDSATGNLSLYRDADITTFLTSGVTFGPTGAYLKNLVRYQLDLADLLREVKEAAMPANCYIRDERDGKISIRPYSQAASASATLQGIVSISQEGDPEPTTATVVVVEDEQPTNMAPVWFRSHSGMDVNVGRVTDGDRNLATSQSAAATRGLVTFTVPGASPAQAFPLIERIDVYGGPGFLTVYLSDATDDYYMPAATNVKLSDAGKFSLDGATLARAAALLDETAEWTLTVQLDADNTTAKPGTVGTLTEIEILARVAHAWRAELSDDPAKVPVAYQPSKPLTQFGAIWVQADPGNATGAGTAGARISYLWAPTSYLKRACPKHAATAAAIRHRVAVHRLQGVTQFDARSYAEDYQLEETYQASPFRVTALLDDRVEIGDTVEVPFPDATSRLMLVEGIEDSGGPDDHLATYTCTDRSATNRTA